MQKDYLITNVVQSEEIKANERIKRILNKTFRELCTEYIN